jgi:transcription elongation GreA/GreB family factor
MAAMTLALGAPAFAQNAGGKPAGKMARMDQDDRNERHPEIRQAIRALERAKDHLQKAAHDFGGHRAEALEACDNAIRQLKLALQYDKK